ncbi:hypothetical protein SAY86_027447 [Trapa natans]|uniref:VQ domain-containing protein n=1 Tax=Trapa natans TaxID=22666 RepID=A0AAN7KUG4_TRANT|nr:hypothetical protein SAY86_027447 [Trapa natans]
MNVLGVTHHKTTKAPKRTGKRLSSSRSKKGVKVVYISSPMQVKTTASEFRMIVQELTGRDSDVASIMEGEASRNRTGDASHLNIAGGEKQCQMKGTAYSDIFYDHDHDHYPLVNEWPAGWESWVEMEGLLDGK